MWFIFCMGIAGNVLLIKKYETAFTPVLDTKTHLRFIKKKHCKNFFLNSASVLFRQLAWAAHARARDALEARHTV